MFTQKFSLPGFRRIDRLIAVAVVLTVYGCAKGEEPEVNFDSDLVFNFPFSGSAVDEVSQEEYDTRNASFLTDRKQKEASAVFFNGDHNYMELDAKLEDPEGTLAFWIFPCLCNEYNPLFVKKSQEHDSLFGKSYVGYDEDGRVMTSVEGKWDVRTESLIDPNTWYHLVFRWSDAEGMIEIFVNGSKVLSEAYTADPAVVDPAGKEVFLGKILNRSGEETEEIFYKGKLDEVRRYSIWVPYDEIRRIRQ